MSSKLTRRLLLATIASVAVFPQRGQAMFAAMTEAQLIDASDIIVLGTLVEHLQVQAAATDAQLRVGRIAVETRLKPPDGLESVLLWLPQPGAPIASDTVFYKIGSQGLWFLRPRPEIGREIYAADNPQRFVPQAQAGPVVKAVRRYLGK